MTIRFEPQARVLPDISYVAHERAGWYAGHRRAGGVGWVSTVVVDTHAPRREWMLLYHRRPSWRTSRPQRIRFAAVVGPASLCWPLMVADGPRWGDANLPQLIGYRWWLRSAEAVRLAWRSVATVNGLSGVLWSSHDRAYVPNVSQRRCWPCR